MKAIIRTKELDGVEDLAFQKQKQSLESVREAQIEEILYSKTVNLNDDLEELRLGSTSTKTKTKSKISFHDQNCDEECEEDVDVLQPPNLGKGRKRPAATPKKPKAQPAPKRPSTRITKPIVFLSQELSIPTIIPTAAAPKSAPIKKRPNIIKQKPIEPVVTKKKYIVKEVIDVSLDDGDEEEYSCGQDIVDEKIRPISKVSKKNSCATRPPVSNEIPKESINNSNCIDNNINIATNPTFVAAELLLAKIIQTSTAANIQMEAALAKISQFQQETLNKPQFEEKAKQGKCLKLFILFLNIFQLTYIIKFKQLLYLKLLFYNRCG